ncbi:MAG: hypothetical protein MJ101_04170 [Clostridia bacterium]|nr:hypothetical protein [Clostridia bacterium]
MTTETTIHDILYAADDGIDYRTVHIRRKREFPTFTMLGVVSVTIILIFCVYSMVQLFGLKTNIHDLQSQTEECRTEIERLEGKLIEQDGGIFYEKK